MSYQVIARKWRPQTFQEVTGQEHITRTLLNALSHERLHHAYLFSGARGVGKTTTARLLTKALNCHKTDKPNLDPCRTDDRTACASCMEISESRSMDVLEIDAASHTGIGDVRETILENININPVRDRYKAFIIDEVHQLSKPAFNALLKTLEEPPENVVFVLATTELHKVPETIRSRCQEFDFRTIALQKIFDRLKLIAKAESVDIDDGSLREIARSGMGSMRDAQSNFDQVISFSGDKISVSDVSSALGIASAEMLRRVVDAISDRSPKLALDVVADLVSRGQDMRNFCRDLLAVFRDLLVFKVSDGDASLVESSMLTAEEMKEYGDRFVKADFLRFFTSLAETETNLKEAMQPRYVLETGLVKLIELRRVVPLEDLLDRLGRLEKSLAGVAESPRTDTITATAPEKKTLVSEPAIPEKVSPPVSEAKTVAPEPDSELPPSTATEIAPGPVVDLGFLENLPVKLAPIDAEALEHVDDTWLDGAYERKLAAGGDDLYPIANASAIIETLLTKASVASAPSKSSNGSAAAAAPALSHIYTPPVFEEHETTSDTPPLSENATQEDMLAFAANHPTTRRVMRVFRAKIVSADRD